MKKLLLSLAFITALHSLGTAQSAKSVYAELGGPGLASFNFDTRFTGKEDGIGGRIGFGGFAIDGSGILFLPIGVNYLMGKDQKNYFELGAGVTPVFATGDITNDGNFSTTFGHLLIGYRLQPKDGGFTFRAFISPVFGQGAFVPYYGGVSFGYKF
ncbi:MAG: hypothetical protein SFU21_15090 [Flavihumibacter sp.]|nr:hypothetical protein [Flavihumibacter sp.]